MKITLAELATITQGDIVAGHPELVFTGFNGIEEDKIQASKCEDQGRIKFQIPSSKAR